MRLNTDLGGKFRTEDATESIKPTLRLRDVIALTVGIIIGAGIFRTPSLVAGAASSEAVMLAARKKRKKLVRFITRYFYVWRVGRCLFPS